MIISCFKKLSMLRLDVTHYATGFQKRHDYNTIVDLLDVLTDTGLRGV